MKFSLEFSVYFLALGVMKCTFICQITSLSKYRFRKLNFHSSGKLTVLGISGNKIKALSSVPCRS